jgi:hypothetical protein
MGLSNKFAEDKPLVQVSCGYFNSAAIIRLVRTTHIIEEEKLEEEEME